MNTPRLRNSMILLALPAVAACGSSRDPEPGPTCGSPVLAVSPSGLGDLKNRAYVASRDTGNITVIDLESMQVVASLDTCGRGYHMLELNSDFTKAFASDTTKSRLDVIDVREMTVTDHITVGKEPTHLSLSRDGKYLAAIDEYDSAVSFIDPITNVELKRLTGFFLPHFVRYAPDGRYAYVANLAAHHVTRVDMTTLGVDGHVALDGYQGPPNETGTREAEGGFADVQIDNDGVLWAAHIETGQTLVYDTKTRTALPQRFAGRQPWIVYAEHPFTEITARAVPTWGDRSVALLDPGAMDAASVETEENESYGVNYTPRAPEKAFVMNRQREEIAVVNTVTRHKDAIIAVGGTTETASTTADGRYIVAAVSSANRVVVIDTMSNQVIKTFDGIGSYPWTVTIPLGQNYCH